MAIAFKKKVYHFVKLMASLVIISMEFNVVSSLNYDSNYTPENVIQEAEVDFQSPKRRPPKEGDGGSRWVPKNKSN